ncbi:MAG: hypothetical protein LBQ15_02530 [Clostridium sp.]|nr:hypothetical protein [Clostridium sp.]
MKTEEKRETGQKDPRQAGSGMDAGTAGADTGAEADTGAAETDAGAAGADTGAAGADTGAAETDTGAAGADTGAEADTKAAGASTGTRTWHSLYIKRGDVGIQAVTYSVDGGEIQWIGNGERRILRGPYQKEPEDPEKNFGIIPLYPTNLVLLIPDVRRISKEQIRRNCEKGFSGLEGYKTFSGLKVDEVSKYNEQIKEKFPDFRVFYIEIRPGQKQGLADAVARKIRKEKYRKQSKIILVAILAAVLAAAIMTAAMKAAGMFQKPGKEASLTVGMAIRDEVREIWVEPADPDIRQQKDATRLLVEGFCTRGSSIAEIWEKMDVVWNALDNQKIKPQYALEMRFLILYKKCQVLGGGDTPEEEAFPLAGSETELAYLLQSEILAMVRQLELLKKGCREAPGAGADLPEVMEMLGTEAAEAKVEEFLTGNGNVNVKCVAYLAAWMDQRHLERLKEEAKSLTVEQEETGAILDSAEEQLEALANLE